MSEATAVVVDTMIAVLGSDCAIRNAKSGGSRSSSKQRGYCRSPSSPRCASELEVAGWGARRRGVLDRLHRSYRRLCRPSIEVTDAYVALRSWAVRTGHGLGAKDHEADRWVAAVAMAATLPLATEDSIFDDVAGLNRADPECA